MVATMTERYYRGQGKVYLAERNPAGAPMGFRYLGNCPQLRLSTQVQKIEHQESYTGRSSTDLVLETQRRAMLMMRLESFDIKNLELALYGQASTVAGATVTDEPHTAYKGKALGLSNINLTSFTTLKNGATTYIAGTDYTVNLKSGLIDILEAGAIADNTSVTATYVAGSFEKLKGFTAQVRNYYLRFDGLNTVENDAPVIVEVYKVRFEPVNQLDLIENQLVGIELSGEALYDDLRADTTDRYFSERQVALV